MEALLLDFLKLFGLETGKSITDFRQRASRALGLIDEDEENYIARFNSFSSYRFSFDPVRFEGDYRMDIDEWATISENVLEWYKEQDTEPQLELFEKPEHKTIDDFIHRDLSRFTEEEMKTAIAKETIKNLRIGDDWYW
ncbi:MAG: hypothetical protein ACOC32_02385 [Nanoarchaeota archaeon]